MGHAEYCWDILDTLGNVIQEKKNPIQTFYSNWGGSGGIYKFNNQIGYWDTYADTIYKISPDMSYTTPFVFVPGDYRLPKTGEQPNSIMEFEELINTHLIVYNFCETKQYIKLSYRYKNGIQVCFIDKKSGTVFLNKWKDGQGSIDNNIDSGLDYRSLYDCYFTENNEEFIVELTEPFELIAHVNSDELKNSIPKYPEKKAALEELVNSLDENDNPVLMVVKLKE